MRYLAEALELKNAGLATWSVGKPTPAREYARIWTIREGILRHDFGRKNESEIDNLYLSIRDAADSLRMLGDADCLVASCSGTVGVIPYHCQVFGTVDGVWLSALRSYPSLRCTALSENSGNWTLKPQVKNFREVCVNFPLRVQVTIGRPDAAQPTDVLPRYSALMHIHDDLLQVRLEPEADCASGDIVYLHGCRNLPPMWPTIHRSRELNREHEI
jgi:hypothetical protein